MAAKKKISRAHILLWVGLGMIGTSIVLTLVSTLFFGRTGSPSGTEGSAASISTARDAVEQVLQDYGNPDLEVAEMMEFANNYYAEVREKSTGIGAMELLVDKPSSRVHPEPGPNMMWNTRYGMMGSNGNGMMGGSYQPPQARPDDQLPISPEDSTQIADDYISRNSLGTETEKPDQFYGYYTLHIKRNGKVNGMLSVNGYTGAVWYHNWHGSFIAMEEEEGE